MRKIFVIFSISIFTVTNTNSNDLDLMQAYPPRDADNFENVVLNYEHFVDKSLLIKDFLAQRRTVVVTRPRRWGKSLNTNMLKTFLQIEVDEYGIPFANNSYKILFTGGSFRIANDQMKHLKALKIAQQYSHIVETHQGKYPVIQLNLAKTFRPDHITMNRAIGEKIRDIFYHDFPFLARYFDNKNITLKGCDLKRLKKYVENGYAKTNAADGFKLLIDAVAAHFNGSLIYVFIDEYDELLYKAYLLYKNPNHKDEKIPDKKVKKNCKRYKRSPDKDDGRVYADDDDYYDEDTSYYADDGNYYDEDADYYADDGADYYADDAEYYADDGSYYADDASYYEDEQATSYIDDAAVYQDDTSSDKDDAYQRACTLLGTMFASIFKDADKVRGLLTGISIITKRELSKDYNLNYIAEDTILYPLFTEHYGFTEDEVDLLLTTSPFTPKSRDIRHWYKSYVIGGTTIYNPVAIMQCLRKAGDLGPHSVDTGAISIIKKSVSDEVKNEWIALMYSNTKIIVKISKEQLSYTKVTGKRPREDVYTHLLFHGYFTSVPISDDYYKISIPNHEIRSFMFNAVVRSHLEKELGVEANNSTNKNWKYHFASALHNYQMKRLKNEINKALTTCNRARNNDQKNQTREFYHHLTTLLVFPLSRYYIMNRHNLNSGKSVQLALIPAITDENMQNAIIIGIRYVATKYKKALLSRTKSILRHIYNSTFHRNIERNTFVKNIYSIGIIFCKGKARVRFRLDANPNYCSQ